MIEFERAEHRGGSAQVTINVSRNGEPFGQLWTWPNTNTTRHPWHAKPLDGEHETFAKLSEAKEYMRSC